MPGEVDAASGHKRCSLDFKTIGSDGQWMLVICVYVDCRYFFADVKLEADPFSLALYVASSDSHWEKFNACPVHTVFNGIIIVSLAASDECVFWDIKVVQHAAKFSGFQKGSNGSLYPVAKIRIQNPK